MVCRHMYGYWYTCVMVLVWVILNPCCYFIVLAKLIRNVLYTAAHLAQITENIQTLTAAGVIETNL